jgi:hypothetical protein
MGLDPKKLVEVKGFIGLCTFLVEDSESINRCDFNYRGIKCYDFIIGDPAKRSVNFQHIFPGFLEENWIFMP